MSRTLLLLLVSLLVSCSATELPSESLDNMTTADIPLTKGVDESTDPKVAPWAITELADLRYDVAGKLVPRDAMAQENAATTRVRRMLNLNGSAAALVESSATADSDLLLYRRNATTKTWSAANNALGAKGDVGVFVGSTAQQIVPLVSDVRRSVVYSIAGTSILTHSVAVSPVITQGRAYRMHAFGLATSTVVQFYLGDTLLDQTTYSGICPKVFAVAPDKWAIFMVDGATGNLQIVKITTLVPTSWPAAATISVGPSTIVSTGYPVFDATMQGSHYYLGIYDSAADMTWAHGTLDDGITQSTTLEAGTLLATAVSIAQTGFTVAWSSGASNHVRAAVVNANGVGLAVAATTVFTSEYAENVAVGGEFLGAGSVLIYASRNTNAGTPAIAMGKTKVATFDTATGAVATLNAASGGLDTFWGFRIAAAPANVASTDYLLALSELVSTTGSGTGAGTARLVVMRWDGSTKYPFPVLAGEPFVGAIQKSGIASTVNINSRAVHITGGRLYFPALEYTDDTSAVRAVLYTAEINGSQVGQSASDGTFNRLELAGGLPVALDSAGSIENVPIQIYPALAVQKGASTGITATVTYIAIYEVEDAQGRIGWSAPSPATAPLTLTNEDVTITVGQLHVTRTPAPKSPKARIYRSDNSGPYRLVTTLTLTRDATGIVNYTDSYATSSIEGNAMLYSDGKEGSEVERFCPPYSQAVAVYRSRMWAASDRRVYFSQPLDSEFMPQWSDIFYVEVPSRVTALAAFKDSLLIFGEDTDAVYYVSGDGPDRADTSGFFAQPSVISSQIGAPTELGGANSVLVVGGKVFFRSARGIELLDMGQSGDPQVVSDPIKSTLAAYPVVYSATFWAERNEAMFLLGTTSTTRTMAVLNLTLNAWTTFSFTNADSCVAYENTLSCGQRTGGIWTSDSTATSDKTIDGSTYAALSTAITIKGNPFGVDGFGRVPRILFKGTNAGRWTAALAVTADGVSYSTGGVTYEETDYAAGAALDLDHKVWTPRLSEIVVRLTATGALQTATWRKPPTWHGVRFELQKLPGDKRTAAKGYL